jgi:hypothetical protein
VPALYEDPTSLWADNCTYISRKETIWEVEVKVELRNIGCEGADWFKLAQDVVKCWAFVNMVMHLQILCKVGSLIMS